MVRLPLTMNEEKKHLPPAGKRIAHHYQGQVQNIYQGQVQNIYQGQVQNIYQGQVQNIYQGQVQNIHPERESKDKLRINCVSGYKRKCATMNTKRASKNLTQP